MIQNRLFALLAVIFIALSQTAQAQDPAFTQFYGNPLYLNPAMAGSANCPRISMNHRNQWPNLKGAFISSSISIDKNIETLHGGVVIQILNDIQGEGALSNTQVSAMYSYQLQATRKLTVLTGVQATYQQRSLDKTKLHFGDEIDPNYGFVFPTQENVGAFADNVSYADLSIGMMAFTKKNILRVLQCTTSLNLKMHSSQRVTYQENLRFMQVRISQLEEVRIWD